LQFSSYACKLLTWQLAERVAAAQVHCQWNRKAFPFLALAQALATIRVRSGILSLRAKAIQVSVENYAAVAGIIAGIKPKTELRPKHKAK